MVGIFEPFMLKISYIDPWTDGIKQKGNTMCRTGTIATKPVNFEGKLLFGPSTTGSVFLLDERGVPLYWFIMNFFVNLI